MNDNKNYSVVHIALDLPIETFGTPVGICSVYTIKRAIRVHLSPTHSPKCVIYSISLKSEKNADLLYHKFSL